MSVDGDDPMIISRSCQQGASGGDPTPSEGGKRRNRADQRRPLSLSSSQHRLEAPQASNSCRTETKTKDEG